MKRSEFIDRLYLEMNKRLIGEVIDDRDFVDKMVSIIEELGMLPPQVGEYNVAQIILDAETDDATCVHYWEPEDEVD